MSMRWSLCLEYRLCLSQQPRERVSLSLLNMLCTLPNIRRCLLFRTSAQRKSMEVPRIKPATLPSALASYPPFVTIGSLPAPNAAIAKPSTHTSAPSDTISVLVFMRLLYHGRPLTAHHGKSFVTKLLPWVRLIVFRRPVPCARGLSACCGQVRAPPETNRRRRRASSRIRSTWRGSSWAASAPTGRTT